jgi:hypothetical protein
VEEKTLTSAAIAVKEQKSGNLNKVLPANYFIVDRGIKRGKTFPKMAE